MNGDETVVGSYPPEREDDLSYQPGVQAGAGPDHMDNFRRAIDDALSQWERDGERDASLTLKVKVKKVNPGWILRYKAHLTPDS